MVTKRSKHSTIRLIASAAAILSVACGRGQGDGDVVVRDSAGITIVENHTAAWTGGNAWTLAAEPFLSIGAVEGPEEYQLFRVRAALRLPNGGLFITNGGTNEIRLFDEGGRHVRSVGREGGGPGEFKGVGAAWRYGLDSVLVADQGRFAVFHLDGSFGRTSQLPTPPDGPATAPQGVFDDASLLMRAPLSPFGSVEGLWVDSVEYLRYTSTGDLLNRMARRPRSTLVLKRIGDGGIVMIAPYTPRPSAVVQHDRWFYGEGADYEIERYSPTGRLTHLYRRSIPNRPVTRDMVDEFREGANEESPPSPQNLEMRRNVNIPSTMPAYLTLQAGTDGTLWVQHYTREDEQPRWSAFRDDGRYLGDLDIPMGARVLEIGADYWVLLETDELDIEYVRVFELLKGQ